MIAKKLFVCIQDGAAEGAQALVHLGKLTRLIGDLVANIFCKRLGVLKHILRLHHLRLGRLDQAVGDLLAQRLRSIGHDNCIKSNLRARPQTGYA